MSTRRGRSISRLMVTFLFGMTIAAAACSGGDSEESAPEAPRVSVTVEANPDGSAGSVTDADASADLSSLVTWNYVPIEEMTLPPGPEFNPANVAFVQGRYVAVGGGYEDARGDFQWTPQSWHSLDGVTWERGRLADAAAEHNVRIDAKYLVPLPDRLLAIGPAITVDPSGRGLPSASIQQVVYATDDGVNWDQQPISGEVERVVDSIAGTGFLCRTSDRAGVDGVDDERWVDTCNATFDAGCYAEGTCPPPILGTGHGDGGVELAIPSGHPIFNPRFIGDAILMMSRIPDNELPPGPWQSDTDLTSEEQFELEASYDGPMPVFNEEWWSDDEGQTWTKLELPIVDPTNPPDPSASLVERFSMAPANTFYRVANLGIALVVDYDFSAGNVAHDIGAWVSADGGQTWYAEVLPGFAVDESVGPIVGGGTTMMALATGPSAQGGTRPYGVFVGSIDATHPALDSGRIIESTPPAVDEFPSNEKSDDEQTDTSTTAGDSIAVLFPECDEGSCGEFDRRTLSNGGRSVEVQAFNINHDGYPLEVGIVITEPDGTVTWSLRRSTGFGLVFAETDTTGNLFYSHAITNHSAELIVIDPLAQPPNDFATVDGPVFVESFNQWTEGELELLAPRRGWPDNTQPTAEIDIYRWNGTDYEFVGCRELASDDEPSLTRCPNPIARPTVER